MQQPALYQTKPDAAPKLPKNDVQGQKLPCAPHRRAAPPPPVELVGGIHWWLRRDNNGTVISSPPLPNHNFVCWASGLELA